MGMQITLIGTSGMRWPVHGIERHAGLTLSEGGVEGLIDSPVETQWVEDTEMGVVFGGVRYLPAT
ncbi:hypothetical protein SAMN04488548_13114 [Gordonia westfalica]|uniref:Uncharacterized protein n=2 Tax=Gordonia westfalica TaxID=158898 RepID=A0A1H2EGA8_9ACTN|nr:hypothetical protein SAMN04488548_13114 [Gordonia westfalica]